MLRAGAAATLLASFVIAGARPARAVPPPDPPEPAAAAPGVEELERAYLEADFLRCLALARDPSLGADGLLERGRRADVARAATLAAACALGAGDEQRAREQAAWLLARELDEPGALRGTTPAFQQLVEEERRAAQRRGRVALELSTVLVGGDVEVDGRLRCPSLPCRVHVFRGEHLVVVRAPGREAVVATVVVEQDRALALALGPPLAPVAPAEPAPPPPPPGEAEAIRLLRASPPPLPAAPPPARPRRRLVWWAAGVGVVLVGAAVAVLVTRDPGPTRHDLMFAE
jgi:hypothetical protein